MELCFLLCPNYFSFKDGPALYKMQIVEFLSLKEVVCFIRTECGHITLAQAEVRSTSNSIQVPQGTAQTEFVNHFCYKYWVNGIALL